MPAAECPICLEQSRFPEDWIFFLTCGHGLCLSCSQRQQWTRCPACRACTLTSIYPPRRIFVQLTPEPAQSTEGTSIRPPEPEPVTAEVAPSDAPESDAQDADEAWDPEIGADAEDAFEALEALADAPHLDSTTKAGIFNAVRILDRDLRPSFLALRAENAQHVESRGALLACAEQYRERVQALEGENARLAGGLRHAEISLRAHEGMVRDRRQEILTLRDALRVAGDNKDHWKRRADKLAQDVRDREDTITRLKDENRTLAAKLDGYEHGVSSLVFDASGFADWASSTFWSRLLSMSTAPCPSCAQNVQFPDKWLQFPNCGHAFCEACAKKAQGNTCPSCHAATLGRPFVRILGVRVNEVVTVAQLLAERAEKTRLLKELEEAQTGWDEARRTLGVLRGENIVLIDNLRTLEVRFVASWTSSQFTNSSQDALALRAVSAAAAPAAHVVTSLSILDWGEALRFCKEKLEVMKPKVRTYFNKTACAPADALSLPARTTMPSAKCTLCLVGVPFPDEWLLFPNCGHAFCETCAKGDRCPTCRAASFGRPLLRIRGVRIDEREYIAALLAERAEKTILLRELNDARGRWERLRSVLMEFGALEGVLQAVQTKIVGIQESMRERDAQIVKLRECAAGLEVAVAAVETFSSGASDGPTWCAKRPPAGRDWEGLGRDWKADASALMRKVCLTPSFALVGPADNT
ncbi:hypothetical protein HDZ31DRAFT_36577 [Schizophyllum fasciatum]